MMNSSSRKKECSFVAVMVFFLFLISFTFCEAAAPPKVRELKLAMQYPETTYQSSVIKKLRDDIETFTNGSIKLKLYWVGQIAETKDLPDLCRTGAVEMAHSSPAYNPSILPLNAMLQIFPVLFETTEKAAYIWRNLSRSSPEIQEEFAKQNQYCLNRTHVSPYFMVSRKSIRNLADFNNLKLRAFPGKYCSEWMKSLGAENLSFPVSELYEALMRRVIDGTVTSVQFIESLKLYEVAKYVSFDFGSHVGPYVTINLDVWNSFTPEIKEAFTRATTQFGARDFELNLTTEKRSIEFLKGKGVEFVEISAKDRKSFKDKGGDPWVAARDSLVSDLKVDSAVADRFLKRWRELSDEYEKRYLSTGKKWEYK